MKEIQELVNWVRSFSQPDPAMSPIKEWLEVEEGESLKRGMRLVARIGVVLALGLVGVSIALLCGLMLSDWHMTRGFPGVLTYGLSVVAGAALAIALGPPIVRKMPAPRLRPYRIGEAIDELSSHQGIHGLRRKIGEHGVLELSEGATLYLRCRSALTSEIWLSLRPEDPWQEARLDMLRAVETTMGQLALFVVKQRSFSEIANLLEQLRSAATEAEKATARRSQNEMGSSRDLRASLARMRELTLAEEEMQRLFE